MSLTPLQRESRIKDLNKFMSTLYTEQMEAFHHLIDGVCQYGASEVSLMYSNLTAEEVKKRRRKSK